MKRSLITAGLVSAGLSLPVVLVIDLPEKPGQTGTSSTLQALIDPAELASQMCGDSTATGYRSSRAAFIRIARVYAAEAPDTLESATAPPLWPGLGDSEFRVTTSNANAQAYFNQGLRIANDFNHLEAVRAFRWAQRLDPACAMCYWGEALALGPNINAMMAEEDVARAYAAAQKASSLAEGVSDRERALIDAMATRYGPEGMQDRVERDQAYAQAMQKVAAEYPADDDILAMAAEAMMNAQPWDYWEADARTPRGRTADILALLETVLERNPEHAASIHLYIHLTEASTDPYRAEAGADRLGRLAPAAAHLVHMPSHIYHRVGRFIDAYQVNLVAVQANERYLADADASALYEFGYYTHNIHSALTSAQMAGDAEAALQMAEKLDVRMPTEMVRLAPWVQAIKVAPYFAYVQFAPAESLLALPDPGDDWPYLQAMWRYARGEALARRGDEKAAYAEAARIEALAAHPALLQLEAELMPAPTLVRIAADVVRARAELYSGKLAKAISRLETAAALQDYMYYSEPSYWYFPVRQMLGAALLLDGQVHRAESVFVRALVDAPNNAWALYGLREAHRAMGDEDAGRYADALFQRAWVGDKNALDLKTL